MSATYRFKKPVLIMTLGLPGSGKTKFASQFANTLNAAHVSSDRIRHEMFESPDYSEKETERVFAVMDYIAEGYLNHGISVIYDANNNRRMERKALREKFAKKVVKSVIVWVQTDEDSCYNRASGRDRRTQDDKYSPNINEEIFNKLKKQIQKPHHEDYVVISGKHTYRSQFATVKRKLAQLGLIGDGSVTQSSPKQIISNPGRTMLGGRVDLGRRRPPIR